MTGPQAFPRRKKLGRENPDGSRDIYDEPGMTLRDWFAGQAPAGILAGRYTETQDGHGEIMIVDSPRLTAELAYEHADAMLAERSGGAK